MKRRLATIAFLLTIALGSGTRGVRGGLLLGDVLVSDLGNSTLVRVDPLTGARSLFSGGGVGAGAAFQDPRGIAVDGVGNVIVADDVQQALYLVNPHTGDRTILSGAGVGAGVGFVDPLGVTYANGYVYVADGGPGAGQGFIVRVNEATGERTLISGLGAGSGAAFDNPVSLAAGGGRLYVTDLGTFADPGRVLSVDLISGARSVLSGGGVGAGPVDLNAPRGIVVLGNGQIATADAGGLVIGIDPTTGDRVSLSGGTAPGVPFTYPYGLALDAQGRLLVSDPGDLGLGTLPTLYRLDPTTGNYSVLSRSGLGSGPDFNLLDIGVVSYSVPIAVPEPAGLTMLILGAVGLGVPCWRRCSRR